MLAASHPFRRFGSEFSITGVDPKRLFNAERLTFKAVFPNRGASFGPTVTAAQPGPQSGLAVYPRLLPAVEFGAVGATAHMVDEHVAIADLEALTEIYTVILEDYFR